MKGTDPMAISAPTNTAEVKAHVRKIMDDLLDPDTAEVVDFEMEAGTRVLNPDEPKAWVERGYDGTYSVLLTVYDPARRTPDPT